MIVDVLIICYNTTDIDSEVNRYGKTHYYH